MAENISPVDPENAEREGADAGVASARQRFQRISDDVRRGAERASSEIRRGAERARETYGEVAQNAERSFERVRSEAGNLSREVSLFVRDNPGKSVLIAAGVGFLLGLVARRRGDDDEV